MRSWSDIQEHAKKTSIGNMYEFITGLDYFEPVTIENLEVGDRVVCIGCQYLSLNDPSKLGDCQAWDVPVVRVMFSRFGYKQPESVFVDWMYGAKPLSFFRGLVFNAPYVVSLGKDVRSSLFPRKSDDFGVGSKVTAQLKFRCCLDDFLPNPPIRQFVYNQIRKNDISALKHVFFSHIPVLKAFKNKEQLLSNARVYCNEIAEKVILQRIITAHHTNNLLGQILKEGCLQRVKYVMDCFHVNEKVLNSIKIDSIHQHPTEVLIRNRNVQLIGFLVKKYHLKLFGKIISHCKTKTRNFSAVLSAVEQGDSSTLRELKISIPKGLFHVMLTFPDELGRTPLSIAVVKGDLACVKTLLDLKAPADQISWGGDTALAIGLQIGVSKTIISILLDAGATLDRVDSTGVRLRAKNNFRRFEGTCSG